jgi:thiamine pyrophosphokinase
MKGVAFIGGDGPGGGVCRELARGAGVIVAADSGLLLAERAGVRPDWIVGDMDSLGDERRLRAYPGERTLRYPPDKDWTDTELALSLLWEKGCDTTLLLGGGGGRTAHLLALAALFERERCPCRWRTAREDIFALEGEIRLETEPGAVVSVFPLGEGPWEAESVHLRWELSGVAWRRGFFGISNRATATEARITARSGRFLIILECSA